MPLNLNVGVVRKIGQPDFGSLGASCSVAVELPHDIIFSDLEAFHRQVRNAYAACAQAVNDELARHQQAANPVAPNGHATNGRRQPDEWQRPACQRQRPYCHDHQRKAASYARQLAKSIQGLGIRGLDNLAQRMYNKPLVALTTLDASGLIDSLKAVKDGKIDILRCWARQHEPCRNKRLCLMPAARRRQTIGLSLLTGMNVSEGRVAARGYADHPKLFRCPA